MSAEWATQCLSDIEAKKIVEPISDLLDGIKIAPPRQPLAAPLAVVHDEPEPPVAPNPDPDPIESGQLF
jgi:hypothetical protein